MMSTNTSVPHPRISGLEASDSALFATLLREAPIGFALFDTELWFGRVNETRSPGSTASRPRTCWASGRPRSRRGDRCGPRRGRRPQGHRRGPPGARRRPQHRRPPLGPLLVSDPHGPEGEASGVVLIVVDVTDRVLAEYLIRRKEERYRSLVEASSQVVWVTAPDRQGRRRRARSGARSPARRPRSTPPRAGWAPCTPRTASASRRRGRRCVGGDRVFEANYRVRTRSGGYRHYDVRAVPDPRATARSSSGSAPTPTSPASARPRRCAGG